MAMTTRPLWNSNVLLSIGVFLIVASSPVALAQAPIAGWAWSDTLGWISLNCSDLSSCGSISYGLARDNSNQITGYAWSDYAGWISAMPTDLVGCPFGTCEFAVASDGTVSGWLKVLNAQNGWDGWISLRNTGYGVTHNAGELSGWAWGDAVTGWLLFSADQPCAMTAGNFCDGNAWKYRAANCAVTTIVADCGPGGCSSVTNQCVSPPAPVSLLAGTSILKVTPSLVQPGQSSTVSWDIANATSCTVTGNGDVWSGTSGSHPTSAIEAGVRYDLACVGPGGSLDGSANIRIAPRFQEI
jgi:hypothetical protein